MSNGLKVRFMRVFVVFTVLCSFLMGTSAQAVVARPTAPKAVLNEMIKRMSKVQTLRFSGDLEAKSETRYTGSYSSYPSRPSGFSATFDLFLDAHDELHPKMFASGEYFNAPQRTNTNKVGDFKVIALGDEALYLNIGSDQLFAFIEELTTFDLGYLNKQWVKIDKETLNKYQQTNEFLNEFSSSQAATQLIEDGRLTPKQEKAMVLALQKSNVFKIIPLKAEVVNGVSTFHYKLQLNQGGVKKFMLEAGKIIGAPKPTSYELQDINDFAKELAQANVQLWVGKADYLPRKLTFSFSSQEKSTYSVTKSSAKLNFYFDSFNDIPSIDAPSQFKPLDEVIAEVQKMIATKEAEARDVTKPLGRDNKRISDLKELQTALELYYTDHDSYPAGENVVLGSGNYACLNSDGWKPASDCAYPYTAQVPADPGTGTYTYSSLSDSASANYSYNINAALEGEVSWYSGKITVSPWGINQVYNEGY